MPGGSLDVPHDLLNFLGSFHAVDTELRYYDGLPCPMSLLGIHGSREAKTQYQFLLKLVFHPKPVPIDERPRPKPGVVRLLDIADECKTENGK